MRACACVCVCVGSSTCPVDLQSCPSSPHSGCQTIRYYIHTTGETLETLETIETLETLETIEILETIETLETLDDFAVCSVRLCQLTLVLIASYVSIIMLCRRDMYGDMFQCMQR